MSSRTSFERQYSYKEAFLASLSRSVAAPTDDWPTIRLWKKPSLDSLFKSIKNKICESKPVLSNVELLEWMEKLGLAWVVETDNVIFYLLEMGASADSEIDPLELMMAYEPRGVVCYFSALAFHSLTSQVPSHHHVAALTESSHAGHSQETQPEGESREEGQQRAEDQTKTMGDGGVRAKTNPFGKKIFSYFQIPYYLTRRKKRLVPGVQTRSKGPRDRFRITTYEQSLLDTLHKPQNCGGPAVVLEAWQEATASGRFDEERLLDYLIQMDYPSTARRVGAMLQMLGYAPGARLDDYLRQVEQSIDRCSPYSQISLLPGFDYSNLDEAWLVRMP